MSHPLCRDAHYCTLHFYYTTLYTALHCTALHIVGYYTKHCTMHRLPLILHCTQTDPTLYITLYPNCILNSVNCTLYATAHYTAHSMTLYMHTVLHCALHTALHLYYILQLGPRYEGQLKGMTQPISHPVSALVRTHDFSSLKVCGRTGRDGWDVCEKTRTLFLRTIFSAVCCGGGGVYRGPRATSCSAPNTNYHRLYRLVLHRQTSAQNGVRGRGNFRRGRAY